MSDAQSSQPAQTAVSRRQRRLDRQARVGLLRNPNRPPKPPPRRAALMGKWLDLRSSRRAPLQDGDAVVAANDARPDPPNLTAADFAYALEESTPNDPIEATLPAVEAAPPGSDAVSRSADGRVSTINIDGLMASVQGLGTEKPKRAAFAADMRPDVEAESPRHQAEAPPSVLTAAAWVDDDDLPTGKSQVSEDVEADLAPDAKPKRKRKRPLNAAQRPVVAPTPPAAVRPAAKATRRRQRIVTVLSQLGLLLVFVVLGCLIGLVILLLY